MRPHNLWIESSEGAQQCGTVEPCGSLSAWVHGSSRLKFFWAVFADLGSLPLGMEEGKSKPGWMSSVLLAAVSKARIGLSYVVSR